MLPSPLHSPGTPCLLPDLGPPSTRPCDRSLQSLCVQDLTVPARDGTQPSQCSALPQPEAAAAAAEPQTPARPTAAAADAAAAAAAAGGTGCGADPTTAAAPAAEHDSPSSRAAAAGLGQASLLAAALPHARVIAFVWSCIRHIVPPVQTRSRPHMRPCLLQKSADVRTNLPGCILRDGSSATLSLLCKHMSSVSRRLSEPSVHAQALLGDGASRRALRGGVARLVTLRRREQLTVAQVLPGLRPTSFPWGAAHGERVPPYICSSGFKVLRGSHTSTHHQPPIRHLASATQVCPGAAARRGDTQPQAA